MMTLGRREKCLRKRSGKGSFTGVGCAPDAKPAPPGAAGSVVDQTRLKPCRKRPFRLHNELEPELKTEIPDNTEIDRELKQKSKNDWNPLEEGYRAKS